MAEADSHGSRTSQVSETMVGRLAVAKDRALRLVIACASAGDHRDPMLYWRELSISLEEALTTERFVVELFCLLDALVLVADRALDEAELLGGNRQELLDNLERHVERVVSERGSGASPR